MTRNEEQTRRFQASPPHIARSIGNAVGTAPFKNTNRKGVTFRRKKDRIARKNGFLNAFHQATFLALLAAARIKREEKAE